MSLIYVEGAALTIEQNTFRRCGSLDTASYNFTTSYSLEHFDILYDFSDTNPEHFPIDIDLWSNRTWT